MDTFFKEFRSIITLPDLWPTEREHRRATTLYISDLFIFCASVLYLVLPSSILVGQRVLIYGALFSSVTGVLLLRSGYLRTSAAFSIIMLWLVFSLGSYTEGGITSGLFAANVTIIIFAGLVLGVHGAVGVAVVSIAAGCLGVYLTLQGVMPPPAITNTPLNLLGDFIFYIIMTALLTGIAVAHMDTSSARFEREIEERKRAEEAIALAQARFQSVFDAATEVSIVATDPAGMITVVNRGAEKMLGYRADELIGTHTPMVFHLEREVRERVGDTQHETERANVIGFGAFLAHAESNEWTYVRKDGTHLTVSLDVTPIRGADGQINGYLGVAVDITEKRKIADALRTSEERYRLLLENMNEVVMLVDNDDRIQFVNRRFSELLGYTADEVLGRIGYEILLDQNLHEFLKQTNAQRREFVHSQYELMVNTKDGRKIPFLVSGSPVFDDEKRVIGSIGTWMDISDRKQAEEALRKSERLLRESQEVAHIGYYVTDLATGRWESSPMLNDILGIDETFHFDLLHGTSLVAPAYRRLVRDMFYSALRTKSRLEFDCQIIRHSDAQLRWVSAVGEVEFAPNGSPVRMIGTIQDITERKRLEQQLIQAQKLEGVGTLAGGIAHDFNNLLAMILGAAELMRQQIGGHPRLRKYVDRIIDASERGSSISRQLLIFSRPDQAELKPIPLSQTITELKEMLKHFLPKTITIDASIDDEHAAILGDAGQIHQALLNLSLNAADAMENTGQLTIREFSAAPELLKAKFTAVQPVPYVGISVADTGVGIDASMLEKIFDPFYSTKDIGKGTGLGLAIVHGIVKSHSGFIDVESVVGRGTTFTLYFPSLPRKLSAAPSVPEQASHTATGTILLVEDEDMLREMLQESLTLAGYAVYTASNGTQAIEVFRARGTEIDLVITDMGMPVMGGEELFRQLRKIDPTITVMVASGYLDGTTKEQLLGLGIKAVLTKPFKMREIHSAIHSVLHPKRVP